MHDGDLVGKNYVANWEKAVREAAEAVRNADLDATAHLSYADKPVRDYLLESADDILVHTWDLAQAIGVSVAFDQTVAGTLYDYMLPLVKEAAGSGLFGEPRAVAADANMQTKLLALLGRSENWAEQRV